MIAFPEHVGEPVSGERFMATRTIRTTNAPPLSLSVAHLLELRHRVRHDMYSSPQVAEELARRILRSGDL